MTYEPLPPPGQDKQSAWAWRELQKIAAAIRDSSARVSYATGTVNVTPGDNLKPDGGESANVWLFSASSSLNITGVAIRDENRRVILVNKGPGTVVLVNESSSSSASNRFSMPQNYVLSASAAVEIWRDPIVSRWRTIGSQAPGGGGGGSGGSAASLSAAIVALSPSGYWQCNEASATLADSSGNGYHLGDISGTFTYRMAPLIPGDAEKHLGIIGTGAAVCRISRANPFSVPFSGDWSVFGLVMPLDDTLETCAFFSVQSDGETASDNYQIHAQVGLTGIQNFWENGAGTNVVIMPSPNIDTPEGWPVCVGMVKDGTTNTVKIYRNGRPVALVGYSLEPTGGSLCFMCVGDNGQGDCVIGHVAFWYGTKLTDEQMWTLAQQAGLTQ